ncbi:MAG TPA: glycosyltransferase family 4 protein [Usitatibacter sp.]|nr:glycosyltransferase family 4 protein [Usitatibacter sp.]
MTRRIVMIGSSRETHGGISSMVNVYFADGLFERWQAEYIATHCDGSKAKKAMKAATSWLAFMGRLLGGMVALLHVHIASDASFWRKSLFIVPARFFGVPYILHMHGGDFATFYRKRCGPIARAFLRSLYRHAEVVIALSEEWRAALAEAIPGIRLVVVPNPVEMPATPAAVEEGPVRVLYLGVVKEAKGVYDLLNAWTVVLAAHPDAKLVLAGSGELDRARALATELGIADSVELPGWTAGEAKAALLRTAHVFVLPSHFEALPMAVLEAMAAGLPIVATRVGGIPDAVAHERDGILFEPRDRAQLAQALARLVADPALRASMGASSRRHAAETFSAAVIVPRVEELWERYGRGVIRTQICETADLRR